MTEHRKPDFLVPDRRLVVPEDVPTRAAPIISLDGAREAAAMKQAAISAGENLNEKVTKGWALEVLGKLSVASAGQMYEQMSGETADFLMAMEADIEGRILARLANERRARSWYGRFRTLLIRLGAREKAPTLEVTDG